MQYKNKNCKPISGRVSWKYYCIDIKANDDLIFTLKRIKKQ
jgi:hypothetical protein